MTHESTEWNEGGVTGLEPGRKRGGWVRREDTARRSRTEERSQVDYNS